MTKIVGWASGVLFAVALILFAIGMKDGTLPNGGLAPTSEADRGSVVANGLIDPGSVHVDLGQVGLHSLTHFDVKLTNVALHPIKIVGTPGICVQAGCVEVIDPPAMVLPQQTVTLKMTCDAKELGPFLLNTSVYFDVGDRVGVSVPIKVVASVVDSAKAD
jgi:hypothetical protein